MIITRTLVRPTDTTARIGSWAESSSVPARGSTVTGGEASADAASMDVDLGGLGLVAAALPDEVASRVAGSLGAEQLAAASAGVLADFAAASAADFMEAVDSTAAAGSMVAEATEADIGKTLD